MQYSTVTAHTLCGGPPSFDLRKAVFHGGGSVFTAETKDFLTWTQPFCFRTVVPSFPYRYLFKQSYRLENA